MRRKVSLVILVLVSVLAVAVFLHRQLVRDHLVVRTSTIQPESAGLAEDLQLTGQGEFLYQASRPQVQDAETFNSSCRGAMEEHSIVLGCYTRQRIFIFNVTDERLDGVQQVTAAHELLHAVYDRLPAGKRQELGRILIETAETIDDQRFKDTMATYERVSPDHLENELHSILGTEIAVLPERLESHYRQFFNNRSRIVGFAKQYESAFAEITNQIATYDKQLAALKEEKDELESTLPLQQSTIEAERERLDALRATGDIASYNSAIPAFNERIASYNEAIGRLREIVREYNQIVERRNTLAATQNDLVRQLDSSYSPIE